MAEHDAFAILPETGPSVNHGLGPPLRAHGAEQEQALSADRPRLCAAPNAAGAAAARRAQRRGACGARGGGCPQRSSGSGVKRG